MLIKLSSLGIISITGEKAKTFLQGQITADIKEITETSTRLGAYCTLKGRVIATFRVLEYQSQLHLILPSSMIDLVIEHLKKYAILSKVTVKKNENLSILGSYQTDIAQKLSINFNDLPRTVDSAFITSTKNPLLIIKVPDRETRFEIVGPQETIELLSETYAVHEEKKWRLLNIQAEIPTIFPETSTLFTPHMLNYPALNGVSFKKGCYVGQEIVARTHYLGKNKRQLQYVQLNTNTFLKAGDLFEDKALNLKGTVVDAVSDELSTSLLIVLNT